MKNSQVIVITGASSGIGEGLSKKFSEDGHTVVLLARRKEKLDKIATDIQEKGGQVMVIPCDVTIKAEVRSAITTCIDTFGRVDILIANAGIGIPSPSASLNTAIYEKVFACNVFGALYCFEAVIPHMLAKGEGHLVGISSLAAYRSMPESGAYCASKSALSFILESCRLDLKGTGIQVSSIHPGFIKTPLTDRNQFHMPFLMETTEGVQKIYRAICKKKTLYAFPWPLTWGVKLCRFLPVWLYDRLLSGRKSLKR